MNRIEKVLKKDEKLLIPYITPEFPFPGVTLRLLEALAESGADMIEVGIPFSDPIADGVTIQNSSLVALKNGITLKKIFDLISLFRRNYDTPIILMGYANSIISRGLEKFIFDAVNSGVDGLIVPDLPVDEAENLIDLSKSYGLSNIFLVAPNSSEERIKLISEKSTHFIYCISITGVTGERENFGDGEFVNFMNKVRKFSTKPFVVGFGISKREHVLKVWDWAMGAVFGSALIKKLSIASDVSMCIKIASEFISELKYGSFR